MPNKKEKIFKLKDNIEDTLPDAVIEFIDLLNQKIKNKEPLVDIFQYVKTFLSHYSHEMDRSLSTPEWLYMTTIGMMLLKNSGIFIPEVIQEAVVEDAVNRGLRKKDVKFHLKGLVNIDIIEAHYPTKKKEWEK